MSERLETEPPSRAAIATRRGLTVSRHLLANGKHACPSKLYPLVYDIHSERVCVREAAPSSTQQSACTIHIVHPCISSPHQNYTQRVPIHSMHATGNNNCLNLYDEPPPAFFIVCHAR